jgi:hypothetical protein
VEKGRKQTSDEIQRPDQTRQTVQNTVVDQEWADWLAPTRRSLLYEGGAAAVGLVLGEVHAEEADGNSDFSTPASASLTHRSARS